MEGIHTEAPRVPFNLCNPARPRLESGSQRSAFPYPPRPLALERAFAQCLPRLWGSLWPLTPSPSASRHGRALGAPGHVPGKEVYPEPHRPRQPKPRATAFLLPAGVLLPCWGEFPQIKRGLMKVSQRAFRLPLENRVVAQASQPSQKALFGFRERSGRCGWEPPKLGISSQAASLMCSLEAPEVKECGLLTSTLRSSQSRAPQPYLTYLLQFLPLTPLPGTMTLSCLFHLSSSPHFPPTPLLKV